MKILLGIAFLMAACHRDHSTAPPSASVASASAQPSAETLVPSQPPSPPVPAANGIIVYDPTVISRLHIYSRIPEGEAKRVLHALFGAKHLSDVRQCPKEKEDRLLDPPESVDEARSRGHFAPSVTGAADGSFTAAGRSQRIYHVVVNECGHLYSLDDGSTMLLAVFERQRLVARIPLSERSVPHCASQFGAVVDIDDDRLSEFFFDAGCFWQGIDHTSTQLVRIDGTSLTTIENFEEVYSSDCGGFPQIQPKSITYTVIRKKPGASSEWLREKKTVPCSK